LPDRTGAWWEADIVFASWQVVVLTDGHNVGKTGGPSGSEQGMTTHQTRTPGTCQPADTPVDVVVWRTSRLYEAGFPWALADSLARSRADLHELLSLVDAGCPPDLAARILAPIDEGAGPW